MFTHPLATRFLAEIELLAEKEQCLLWAMDKNFSQEIFVSSTFKTVWQREISDMYKNRNTEEMADYVNSFIHEECFDELHKRLLNPKYTVIYQIKLPHNKLQLVQDRSFHLNDINGDCLLIAGVVMFISEENLQPDSQEIISDKMDKISLEYYRLLSIPCEKVIPPRTETINRLSDKQQIIFKHILHGLNAKEIAQKMHLSFRTIEFHTDKIKEVFKASSKSELVSIAIKENLMGIFF
ncbi:MAG: LuxR family transcriptional regulator [Legionella sp.]|nr:MAG: LuxR family transcriptional regulator [Legionella sp.]